MNTRKNESLTIVKNTLPFDENQNDFSIEYKTKKDKSKKDKKKKKHKQNKE